MKSKSAPFDAIDLSTYMMYIDRAEMLHERGLLLHINVVELAKQLYGKDIENQRGINNESKKC